MPEICKEDKIMIVNADKGSQSFAHLAQEEDGSWRHHALHDHSDAVANLCEEFTSKLTSDRRFATLGKLVGRWHDVGKYQEEFQLYIRKASGFCTTDSLISKAPHSAVGALMSEDLISDECSNSDLLRKIFAYCISSHHRGLYNYNQMRTRLESTEEYLRLKSSFKNNQALTTKVKSDRLLFQSKAPQKLTDCKKNRQLLLRMLFSCLVDADFLDTESFMQPNQSERRKTIAKCVDFSEMRDRLKRKTDSFDISGELNQARARFLELCRRSGKQCERGYYSLFLPTGGGKTLSSMAWALENAVRNNADRIIYVIPYTSIISQTSGIFREIFGEENVLEHHSDIDVEDEDKYNDRKLLSENWDAPIVVTTTVQFFESLFANRPSKCRKLHNIANSIVVFDEVQMFPMPLLNPILRTLDALVEEFQVQVLFCTATLPLLDKKIADSGRRDVNFYPLEAAKIIEVVPYQKAEFDVFRRANFHLHPKEHSIDSLAKEIASRDCSVLCVVNSRADAKKVFDALCHFSDSKDELIHLSRMMCSAHLKDLLAEIKAKLSQGKRIKVISTQLIEAGVDIDFPLVYRAESSLISIIQAGGRCNREGKMPSNGNVYVFKLSDGSKPFGEMRQTAYATSDMLTTYTNEINLNDPEVIKHFYKLFYSHIRFDEKNIVNELWLARRYNEICFNFENAADLFKMIEDTNNYEILVPYGERGALLLDELRNSHFICRQTYREMQRYTVHLSKRDFMQLENSRSLELILIGKSQDKLFLLNHKNCYDNNAGVLLDNPNNKETIIA